MKPLGSSRARAPSPYVFVRLLAGACSAILASNAIAAPPAKTPPTAQAANATTAVVKRPRIAKTQVAWRKSLLQLERPAEGCYASSFPRVEWRPIACGEAPKYPMPPARGIAKHQPHRPGLNAIDVPSHGLERVRWHIDRFSLGLLGWVGLVNGSLWVTGLPESGDTDRPLLRRGGGLVRPR